MIWASLIIFLIALYLFISANKTLIKASRYFYESTVNDKKATLIYREAAQIMERDAEIRKAVVRQVTELRSVHRELHDRVNGEDWEIPEEWLGE